MTQLVATISQIANTMSFNVDRVYLVLNRGNFDPYIAQKCLLLDTSATLRDFLCYLDDDQEKSRFLRLYQESYAHECDEVFST